MCVSFRKLAAEAAEAVSGGGEGEGGGGGERPLQSSLHRGALQKKSSQKVPGQWLQKNWSCPGKAVHVPEGHSRPRTGIVARAKVTRAPMRFSMPTGAEESL